MQPRCFCITILRNQAHWEVMMCSSEWFAVGCVQPEAGCSTSPVSSHAAGCAATHLLGLLLWKLVPKHFTPSFIASRDHGCIVDIFLCLGDEMCFHKVYLVITSKVIGLCSFQMRICLHWWEEYQASGELEGF